MFLRKCMCREPLLLKGPFRLLPLHTLNVQFFHQAGEARDSIRHLHNLLDLPVERNRLGTTQSFEVLLLAHGDLLGPVIGAAVWIRAVGRDELEACTRRCSQYGEHKATDA